jgi:LysM repeat protein
MGRTAFSISTGRDQGRMETGTAAQGRCRAAGLVLAGLVLLSGPSPLVAQSLQGSTLSLDRQNRVAREHDYTFIDTSERVRHFASQGWLVEVRPTADYLLRGVSFPYARPEVELFLRRLGAQYRAACGEQLVVTSLTRPTTRQPRNASDRSVHPTGMAVDLRYSHSRSCRAWLERVLLQLEAAGVVEATRERFPVHYHVAVFPRQYAAYVQSLNDGEAVEVQARLAYTVRSGDSLWGIARAHGTTVDDLRTVNSLRGSRIFVGQVLDVPVAERDAVQ